MFCFAAFTELFWENRWAVKGFVLVRGLMAFRKSRASLNSLLTMRLPILLFVLLYGSNEQSPTFSTVPLPSITSPSSTFLTTPSPSLSNVSATAPPVRRLVSTLTFENKRYLGDRRNSSSWNSRDEQYRMVFEWRSHFSGSGTSSKKGISARYGFSVSQSPNLLNLITDSTSITQNVIQLGQSVLLSTSSKRSRLTSFLVHHATTVSVLWNCN